ncbi:hypothetical protein SAMN05421594_3612 [Chryseobacterium oleae]|uniref:Immunity protein 35 n=1 Tax=Chryseobacterium oleae TaxID=491207 RepID=A0A1I5APF8_CHROL|nr:hypothetical protein [Chryseobacterium oleae]SFN64361.1 hypothetical protein SAMN05421594_3612 [Chryseobacterium oleae]
MLTKNEVKKIAESYMLSLQEETKIELLLLNEETISKMYGDIFFYTSKKLFETNDDKYAIAGNAPFLVENKTGNIIVFGTAHMEDYYIKEYEAGRWPK